MTLHMTSPAFHDTVAAQAASDGMVMKVTRESATVSWNTREWRGVLLRERDRCITANTDTFPTAAHRNRNEVMTTFIRWWSLKVGTSGYDEMVEFVTLSASVVSIDTEVGVIGDDMYATSSVGRTS